MILFEAIYDIIIEELVAHRWISIQDLHTIISKKQTISLPNFYKIIKRLVSNQILIKEDWKLLLHNRRVLGLIDLAEKLKKDYLVNKDQILNLQEWQSIYHEWTSIENIDWIWWDWMLSINRLYDKKEATYVYQAHPYYALGMNMTEMAFFTQANRISDVYFMTGNTKFLDIYGTNLYKEIWIKADARDDLPFLRENYCVTVVGDYVFEVLYPKDIGDYFTIFFETIDNISQFNEQLFQRIFNMKTNIRLTLRRDQVQANQIKKLFKKHLQ